MEELLVAAEHDVEHQVGAEPGTLVHTARPRAGTVRPKIAWLVWPEWPAALASAFAILEKLRASAGAARAIGLVSGPLPEGQAGAVKQGPLDVMTIRRFAFELAKIDEHLASVRASFERDFGDSFPPILGRDDSGEVKDGVEAVIRWVQEATPEDALWISGTDADLIMLMRATATHLQAQFSRAPDLTRLLLLADGTESAALHEMLRTQGWVVLDNNNDSWGFLDGSVPGGIHRAVPWGSTPASRRGQRYTTLRALHLASPAVFDFFDRQVAAHGAAIRRIASAIPDFESLLVALASLPEWVHLFNERWPDNVTSEAEAAARLVTSMLGHFRIDASDAALGLALEDFSGLPCSTAKGGTELGALWSVHEALGWYALALPDEDRFSNRLLRDYFLAHKIIADVRAGRPEILTNHQFPREFVLLFLAILSPEVAALASENRSKAARAEIAAEVEREVQLALAHNLKHPIAMIRGALADARKKVPASELDHLSDEVALIEDATRHIAALVEKTTQWSQVPDETPVPLALSRTVDLTLEPLRREWPEVRLTVQIDANLHVQAGPTVLRTILSNLLENAFQAAGSNGPNPTVTVRAHRTGETVRVEVIDTGSGVHPDDRDRIFEPRVTTKKGGRGKPRGTGMGLPIARKYAEHLRGKLWLDIRASQTTFVLELVPARETANDA
ncbi:MAG: HAMP domain-containing sensor histidine kinase [Polyangiaceae bacterium]